jgi:2-phosphosulfolactate phosphatase
LVNAQAVADALATLLTATPAAVTVIACGERPTDPTQDGQLRVALEDYLGAGAILAALPVAQSPEARVCAGAFRAGRGELAALLWESVSGRELRAKGLGRDVRTAAQLDRYRAVPVLHGERLERWAGSGY